MGVKTTGYVKVQTKEATSVPFIRHFVPLIKQPFGNDCNEINGAMQYSDSQRHETIAIPASFSFKQPCQLIPVNNHSKGYLLGIRDNEFWIYKMAVNVYVKSTLFLIYSNLNR